MIRSASWVSWVSAGTAVTLFDERDGSYHALNASASRIWTELSNGRQPEEIGTAFAAAHRAEAATIRRDVDEFVALALDKGLLVAD